MRHLQTKTPEVQEDPLLQEERLFKRQREKLLRGYAGQFVGLYKGKVLDHDADDEALADRLFARLGEVPFLIIRVEHTPTVHELPSPEL
jgi:hypothetical protein